MDCELQRVKENGDNNQGHGYLAHKEVNTAEQCHPCLQLNGAPKVHSSSLLVYQWGKEIKEVSYQSWGNKYKTVITLNSFSLNLEPACWFTGSLLCCPKCNPISPSSSRQPGAGSLFTYLVIRLEHVAQEHIVMFHFYVLCWTHLSVPEFMYYYP